jgi:hypothetical protein
MTEETELALEILEGLTEAPTTKELARRVLQAKGEEPLTEAKLRATAHRLKHMLLRCERAGVLQNVATCHARGNEWVLVEGWRSKYVPLVKMPLQAKAASEVGAVSTPAE